MKHNPFPRLVFAALLVVVLGVLSACTAQPGGSAKAELPVDKAYAEGKEIYFIHTEASNADVAKKLSDMMDSPVPYVPSLASVPDDSLANVYSFTNGAAGSSGTQKPVFDSPPGTEGYTPLRRLNVVTWTDETRARELKSAAEILDAAGAGELSIKQPGIVINMPFVVWEGGKR